MISDLTPQMWGGTPSVSSQAQSTVCSSSGFQRALFVCTCIAKGDTTHTIDRLFENYFIFSNSSAIKLLLNNKIWEDGERTLSTRSRTSFVQPFHKMVHYLKLCKWRPPHPVAATNYEAILEIYILYRVHNLLWGVLMVETPLKMVLFLAKRLAHSWKETSRPNYS